MRLTMKRSIASAACLAIALFGMTACTAGDAAPSDELTLTAWGAQSTSDATKEALAAYEAETGIKVTLEIIPDNFDQNLLTRWTTGQRPDILFYQPLPAFLAKLNPAENLQDLSDMDFVAQVKYGLEDSGAIDGVHYTATYGFPSILGMFYNSATLDAAGLEYPATLDALEESFASVKDAGVAPLQITGGDAWTTQLPFFELLTDAVADGFIDRINDGSAKWTDPEVVDALTWLNNVVTNGDTNTDYLSATFDQSAAAISTASAAYLPQATWTLPIFEGDYTNVGFAPFPSESGAVMFQASNLISIQLPKTGATDKEEAARDFVDYMTVGEGYQVYLDSTGEPSIYEGVDNPEGIEPIQAELEKSLELAIPSIDSQLLANASDLPGLLSQMIAGVLTPEQTAEQIQLQFADNAALAGIPGY